MKNKKILICGASGSIGSELCRQLAKDNQVVGIDQDESALFDLALECPIIPELANIRSFGRIQYIIEKYQPEIIFNAAAYKHLSNYEQSCYSEIVETNIIGTENLIQLAVKNNVKKFIFISTDKAVNPTSLMGATKLVGEIITRRNGYNVVRFGNVIRSRGSVIPIWQKQFDQGKDLTITDPLMKRYFMSISQACELVIKATEIGKPGETLILDMGEQKLIADVAMELFGDVNFKITGMKEGEKLEEELMTSEEFKNAEKVGKFFIIR